MTAIDHGGDLAVAAKRFGRPPADWIDLSTGVNPWPWPVDPEAVAAFRRLPDSGQLGRLRRAASTAYGVPDGMRLVAAPGTQSLIRWLPRLRPPGRVAVLSPTYGEHAPAWSAAGHDVAQPGRLCEARGADVVVLTRPNNPDGKIADREAALSLARELAGRGGWLVVDEAYADADPAVSLLGAATPGTIVLRSFGKFFGLPGLRLGFAAADPAMADVLAEALGPWPVSSIAAEIGAGALDDAAWQAETRAKLSAAARRLDALLAAAGFDLIGGTSLFRLGRRADAPAVYERLGRAGIHVRRFSGNPRLLRFGLPGPEPHWRRLEKALAA